jgi:hypothetical protein
MPRRPRRADPKPPPLDRTTALTTTHARPACRGVGRGGAARRARSAAATPRHAIVCAPADRDSARSAGGLAVASVRFGELAPALGEGAGGAPECIWASNGCPGTLSGNARWVAYKMRMTVRRAIRYAVPEELGGGARGVFAIFGRFQGWLRSVFKR